jgi:formate dehydrogenase major subunit
MEMIDAAGQGRLKALWAIGYDVALTNPNAGATCRALAGLDLLIVQDLFKNRVADYASVFLPAASPFEQDGTYMNAERRVQRVRPAIAPRGHSMLDWRIICEVARAMGHGGQFDFNSPEEIWDEIRSVWPAGRGITYSRLDSGGGLQWPCPDDKHPGTPILHVDAFAIGGRAGLRVVDFAPTGEQTSPEYPFLLSTGRTLYQFNAGTMTMRTPNARLRPEDTLDISPADAARLGLCDGARATVHSRYGKANLRVHVSESVKPGELFATFHTARAGVNHVTGNRRDDQVGTPEYKVTAVRVEPEGVT